MKQIYPLLGLTVMLAAVGCSNNSTTETTASTNTTAPATEPTSTQTAPTYTVVTETSNIPFAFLDEKANNIGFDIDIVNAIADNQGFSVNYAPASWERIFQEIDSGTADIAVSSISITPERQEKYSFLTPISAQNSSYSPPLNTLIRQPLSNSQNCPSPPSQALFHTRLVRN